MVEQKGMGMGLVLLYCSSFHSFNYLHIIVCTLVCSSVYYFELILFAEISAYSFPSFPNLIRGNTSVPNLISSNTSVMEIDRRRAGGLQCV